MADDDTRYRIVQRRRTTTRQVPTDPAGEADAEKPVRSRRATMPAVPAALASGTAPPTTRFRRPSTAGAAPDPVVMLPRSFGGIEIVVEDHGDHIAIVFPGALRLTGTRDEAVALAAALLHTIERAR